MRREFEDLFVFLTNNLRDYGRLILDSEQFTDAYYIEGNYLETTFSIEPTKNGLSLSLKRSDDSNEAYLAMLISQFKKEEALVSYSIVDTTGERDKTRVYEWTHDLDRIEELKNDSEDRGTFKITDIKYSKDNVKVKQLQRH
jgi:hypothetical protein